jgi:hypothetical protein
LAACIGLTITLNKAGKHATAVFSGDIPSTIEFLQPEKTLEKNTDSLRDFIIALDKSKADRLRYKVEDKYVKIFITPYKTSISEKDLEFSQGDLNCDVIVALGVHQQRELDQAIMAHGRILHDATIISINITPEQNNLGNINWQEPDSSSLSEVVTNLSGDLSDKSLLDSQSATALLTGIVATTKRFSNDRTSPKTMNTSALLLAAGANQQLVADKMEPPAPVQPATISLPKPVVNKKPPKKEDDGTTGVLTIHREEHKEEESKPAENMTEEERLEQIRIDNQGVLHKLTDDKGQAFVNPSSDKASDSGSDQSGATSTSTYEALASEPDSGSVPPVQASQPSDSNVVSPSPSTDGSSSAPPKETLEQLEQDVDSPHLKPESLEGTNPTSSSLEAARNAILQQSQTFKPPAGLGSQPLGPDLHDENELPTTVISPTNGAGNGNMNDQSLNMPLPPSIVPPSNGPGTPPTSTTTDPTAPPPVPPPIIPPFSQ